MYSVSVGEVSSPDNIVETTSTGLVQQKLEALALAKNYSNERVRFLDIK